MTNAAHSDVSDADLMRLARELIAKCRANGHDVVMDAGKLAFRLNVQKPAADVPLVKGKGFQSFALGVDMTPYVPIFEVPQPEAIFAAALQGDA